MIVALRLNSHMSKTSGHTGIDHITVHKYRHAGKDRHKQDSRASQKSGDQGAPPTPPHIAPCYGYQIHNHLLARKTNYEKVNNDFKRVFKIEFYKMTATKHLNEIVSINGSSTNIKNGLFTTLLPDPLLPVTWVKISLILRNRDMGNIVVFNEQ